MRDSRKLRIRLRWLRDEPPLRRSWVLWVGSAVVTVAVTHWTTRNRRRVRKSFLLVTEHAVKPAVETAVSLVKDAMEDPQRLLEKGRSLLSLEYLYPLLVLLRTLPNRRGNSSLVVSWLSITFLIYPIITALTWEGEDGEHDENESSHKKDRDRGFFDAATIETGLSTNKTESSSSSAERHLDILVHNVSHTDLVMSFQAAGRNEPETTDVSALALCRPRFSFFDLYSQKCLKVATSESQPLTVLHSPRYQRSMESLRIQDEPTDYQAPIGMRLPRPVVVESWNDLRIRGRDQPLVGDSITGTVSHIFFPLLGTLLPQWRQRSATRSKSTYRVLILVTGVGTPRNWTHSETGNSTQKAADLMRIFLNQVDPDLHVIHVHSTSNIFRYDENVRFVESDLVPTMEAFRDAHARGLPYPTQAMKNSEMAAHHKQGMPPFNVDWLKSMSVVLSFADGSQARTHAIQACLRPYRPTFFHFWQLKTFWHESKLVDDDIEVHSFETMDTMPPMDVSQCSDTWISTTVNEMKSFLSEKLQATSRRDTFWLRKTQKSVLSVLLVQTPRMSKPVVYRGSNMEVSMPTGSLCAERSVIGSALAQNPDLKREDLKLIAVLAVPPVQTPDALKRVASSSTLASLDDHIRKGSIGSEGDDQNLDESAEWILPDPGLLQTHRRIPLFSSKRSQKAVLVHSDKDRNPLAPCGTCQEWLKKISEANPHFRILTFTDANCNGVYVSRCSE